MKYTCPYNDNCCSECDKCKHCITALKSTEIKYTFQDVKRDIYNENNNHNIYSIELMPEYKNVHYCLKKHKEIPEDTLL